MAKKIRPFCYRLWSVSQLSLQIPAISGACGEMRDLLHYATSCHLTSSFHFAILSAENTLFWWKNFLLNKLSRIKTAKLISFLTDNLDIIKQQPDATSSSDSDPDFSPSLRVMDPYPLEVQYQGL
ncbi:hypothetical protein AVEN_61513-1 [Araneus ventricosus]|uniref:Uncharacterized protein n=1 Tax=Araneus ventricosus TaxID=182803 RepID=A0A4Y2KN72_ARAVE|nr:hypothetical protein AVEN_61513-1 [Araneus ventricosus]